MIRGIFSFLRKEKLYTALFVVLLLIFAGRAIFQPPKHAAHETSASELEQFEKKELAFQAQLKNPAAAQKFFKEHPRSAWTLQISFAGVLIAFFFGLLLDYKLFLNPAFRSRWTVQPPSETVRWSLGMIFKMLVLLFTSGFAIFAVLAMLKRLWGWEWTEHASILIQTAGMDLLAVIMMIWIVRRHGGKLRDLGLRLPSGNWREELTAGFGGYLVLIPFFAAVLLAITLISGLLGYKPEPHPLVNVFLEDDQAGWVIPFSLFLAVFIGPIVEELFFRGFCYPIFKQRWGKGVAMVLSASLFALTHENTFAFWPIFILGLGFAALYEMRRSILTPIAVHIGHNGLFISYFWLIKDMIEKFSG